MKPHELIQRRRQNRRGGKTAPPQMRDRHAAAAAAGGAPAAGPGGIIPIPPDDPRTRMPARRPAFPGETRAQELDRQRASAPIVRVMPVPANGAQPVAAPPPQSTIQQQPQQPQQQPQPQPQAPNVITMCGCTSHGDGDCDNVATLRLVWPNPEGQPWPGLIDVCEECGAAIKADPVASLVTGLAFLPLYPPMHDPIEEEEDPPGRWGPHASPEEAAAKQQGGGGQ